MKSGLEGMHAALDKGNIQHVFTSHPVRTMSGKRGADLRDFAPRSFYIIRRKMTSHQQRDPVIMVSLTSRLRPLRIERSVG